MAELAKLIQAVVDIEMHREQLCQEQQEIVDRLNELYQKGKRDTPEVVDLKERLAASRETTDAYADGYDDEPGLLRGAREALCDYVIEHRDDLLRRLGVQ